MRLSTCVFQFFDQYLLNIKGVSRQTIKTYRAAFSLFLPFAADRLSIKIDSLRIEHLTPSLILDFLEHLEKDRRNIPATRNQRLAAIKSMAKMIRFMHPQYRKLADQILGIPQKRTPKKLIGFLHPDEAFKVFRSVKLNRPNGVRDATILHLLYDSGARASEIAALNLDYFDPQKKLMTILGKANRYRQVKLEEKTVQFLKLYIKKYRTHPKPIYRHRLFINQRGTGMTRYGIYKTCKKYLSATLSPKRLKWLNPVHSFRHGCAMSMLYRGRSISEIKNHLGHENANSTMAYLHMEMTHMRSVQNLLIEYMQANLADDKQIDELIDWENRKEILEWLDSL